MNLGGHHHPDGTPDMAHSPRRSLRHALVAVDSALEVCAKYPEAGADVERSLDDPGLRQLRGLRDQLAAVVARLDGPAV